MAKSLLEQKQESTPPDGQVQWDKMAAAVELLVGSMVGGGLAGTAGTYTPVVLTPGASVVTTIPAGVLSWAVTVVTGTATTNINLQSKTLATGQTVRSGGYLGKVSSVPIVITTATSSSALVVYDIIP